MNEETKPTYLQRLIGDVRVLVLGARMLTEQEFDAHVAEALDMAEKTRVVMVVILGSPPMSAERRAKLARTGLTKKRTAVLTDSVAMRAVLTAISWFGGDLRPFSMGSAAQACEFLEIPQEAREALVLQVSSMSAAILGDAPRERRVEEGLARAVDRIKSRVDERAESIRRRRE